MKAKQDIEDLRVIDFIMIIVGTALYAWGLVNINIPNQLAEGGISGVTLILYALFKFNPAYTTIILNIPILLLGFKLLGKRSLIYTLLGILSLSSWLWFWQKVPMPPMLNNDMLIAGLLAGIAAGVGLGIVFRFGGTSGGTDVIARIVEQRLGIPIGKTMFFLDAIVLIASLIYIDILHMMYTLIASFVFAQFLNIMEQGAYPARTCIIFTNYPEEIAHAIMEQLERGTSLLKSEGGYTHREQRVVYAVIAPSEIQTMRRIIEEVDPKAFVSIINTQEQHGEGFSYLRPRKKYFSFSK